MPGENTTIAMQRYLDDLNGLRGVSLAEPIVRDLFFPKLLTRSRLLTALDGAGATGSESARWPWC
jgi:hypothetical protein